MGKLMSLLFDFIQLEKLTRKLLSNFNLYIYVMCFILTDRFVYMKAPSYSIFKANERI